MLVWLVTVRAAHGESAAVADLLTGQVLPLLRDEPDCSAPAVARCVRCVGEHTYMARWQSHAAIEAFEAAPAYARVVRQLAGLLRTDPKRELWELLS